MNYNDYDEHNDDDEARSAVRNCGDARQCGGVAFSIHLARGTPRTVASQPEPEPTIITGAVRSVLLLRTNWFEM